jgi:hypothetical protein
MVRYIVYDGAPTTAELRQPEDPAVNNPDSHRRSPLLWHVLYTRANEAAPADDSGVDHSNATSSPFLLKASSSPPFKFGTPPIDELLKTLDELASLPRSTAQSNKSGGGDLDEDDSRDDEGPSRLGHSTEFSLKDDNTTWFRDDCNRSLCLSLSYQPWSYPD